jgi:putative transposase
MTIRARSWTCWSIAAEAALRLTRELLEKQGFAPKLLVTDKLRSYASAFRQLGPRRPHERSRRRTGSGQIASTKS